MIDGPKLDGKVMVTGGAGYIGSHAVLALLDAGYGVVVLDNLVTGFDWAVDPRATLVEANVADDAKVRAAIRDHGVKAIMHFAGSVVVPESVSDPLKYYRNNTAASRALIESAVVEGVPHFIFSSTAATYGTPEKVPVAEGDPTVPQNSCAASAAWGGSPPCSKGSNGPTFPNNPGDSLPPRTTCPSARRSSR